MVLWSIVDLMVHPVAKFISIFLSSLILCIAMLWGFSLSPSYANRLDPAPTIMAAGDIACAPASAYFNGGKGQEGHCQMQATANLIIKNKPTAVLALGDNQYERGELANYRASYDKSWGKFKAITKPVPGNHEYYGDEAAGYYDYFGALAGDRQKGYYSFNLGNWHLIALNSNCKAVGGCGVGSAQEKWLKDDLKANPKTCTLAYWHHPRFSSGVHGSNSEYEGFWQALYAAKADVVLTAHDHGYERFAPQGMGGKADPKAGVREFVVGSGGKNLYALKTLQAHSEIRSDKTFGVLKLVLNPQSYSWDYLTIGNGDFQDQGTTPCH